MQLYLCTCFNLKTLIVCYCIDFESTPGAHGSVQSSSSQSSKSSTGNSVEEEEQKEQQKQEDQKEEEQEENHTQKQKRLKPDNLHRNKRERSNLAPTGGYSQHSLNVVTRRQKR